MIAIKGVYNIFISELDKSINKIDARLEVTTNARSIEKLENMRKLLITYKIQFDLFEALLGAYNVEAAHLILSEGYKTFSFGFKTGNIYIKKKKRYFGEGFEGLPINSKVPDWGESNKIKAEIIARGGTPYKAIKNSRDEIIGDNGGEKWIVYHISDYVCWWWWNKGKCNIENRDIYMFKPTRGMNEEDDNGEQVKFNSLKDHLKSGKLNENDIKTLKIGTQFKLKLFESIPGHILKYE